MGPNQGSVDIDLENPMQGGGNSRTLSGSQLLALMRSFVPAEDSGSEIISPAQSTLDFLAQPLNLSDSPNMDVVRNILPFKTLLKLKLFSIGFAFPCFI